MINDIINNWNPIDLFPYAPSDEYDGEIKILESCIKNSSVIQSDLAIEIHRVFAKSFGDDVFKKGLEECNRIAGDILRELFL